MKVDIKDLRFGDWVEYNGSVMQAYGLCGPMPDKNPYFDNKPTVTLWCNGLLTVALEDIEGILHKE